MNAFRGKAARILAAFLLAALAGCASTPDAQQRRLEERGRAIAEANCGGCHATGRFGESPAPEAPPFRRLSDNYRVAMLEEALAEGISVGHPAMPEFQFAPDDTAALIGYLQSIQERDPG
jgi:mono/diheme cytochrome c family protein